VGVHKTLWDKCSSSQLRNEAEKSDNFVPSIKWEIQAYPNPANDRLIVESNTLPTDNVDIQLFDLTGRLLVKKNIFESAEIDLSDFNSGVYLLTAINSNGQTITQKIVVLK
jgi:Secretion system C-terminal sorting domain